MDLNGTALIKFQLYNFNMLLARLRTNFAARLNSFCTASKVNSIHFRILGLTRWDNFIELFNKQSEQFTPDVLLGTSRHIINLLNRAPNFRTYSTYIQITKVMQEINIEELDSRNTVNLLTLMRQFSKRGFSSLTFFQLKSRLCRQYTNLLSKKSLGQVDVSELLFGYYEMVFFKNVKACNMIVRHLMNNIGEQNPSKGSLTISQLSYLLHIYAYKGHITFLEHKIRSYVISTLVEKINILRLSEVISIASDLNRIDGLDMSNEDKHNVKIIGQKVLENINQLEERNIIEFLKSDHHNTHNIFKKIYVEFATNIFAQIEEDGTCEMQQKLIMYFMFLLCDKLSFASFSLEQKKKYHNFLKEYAKSFSQSEEEKKIQNFMNQLSKLIKNNYFEISRGHQITEVVQILSDKGFKINGQLLSSMVATRIDISPFLQFYLNDNEQYRFSFIDQACLLNDILKDSKYQSFKSQVERKMEDVVSQANDYFSSPDAFVEAFSYALQEKNNSQHWRDVDTIFGAKFREMASPLEQESRYIESVLYLEYIIKAFKFYECSDFFQKNGSKITLTLLVKLLNRLMEQDSRDSKHNKNIVNLILTKIDSIFEKKNRNAIQCCFDFLIFYNRHVIIPLFDHQGQVLVFKIIHQMIKRVDQISQMAVDTPFANMLEYYLIRNMKNYNVDSLFRSYLDHLLKNIGKFTRSQSLSGQIISHGLRLGMINKEIADSIDLESNKTINFTNASRIRYFQDNTYVPEIHKVSSKTLKIIIENHNLNNIIQQNQQKIISIIKKLYLTDAVELLVTFNQPRNPVTTAIIKAIIQHINSLGEKSFDSADFVGAIKKIIDRGFYNMSECKELAEKLVNHAKSKVSQYSLESHKVFIKFIASQSSVDADKYYKALLEWARYTQVENDVNLLISTLRLTNVTLPPQYQAKIPNFIKRDPFHGIATFLAFEQQLDEERRKECVNNYVETCNKRESRSCSELRYNYLVRHYPDQMAKLESKPTSFTPYVHTVRIENHLKKTMDAIAEYNGIQGEYEKTIIDNNTIIKIKNYNLVFVSPKSNGAYLEHNFFKRALTEELADDSIVVLIGRCSRNSLARYLNKEVPELVPEELLSKLGAQKKDQVTEEEEEHSEQ